IHCFVVTEFLIGLFQLLSEYAFPPNGKVKKYKTKQSNKTNVRCK
ncbi:conserved hypothetical protein, partial [Listeria monocytogenes FSL F2-208]